MTLTQVNSGGIKDATIATADIADDAVTAAKIADGTITSTQIAANTIGTGIIADQAITLAKLPHGTSSNDGKFLRANNGADPTFETVNTDISGNLDGGLNSNGYNLNFADSNGSQDMAKFGAGGDLQIYHDGAHSRIDEVGTGNLMIQTNNSVFIKKGTSENIATFNVDGACELYHNNAKKLETYANGVVITGTVAPSTINMNDNNVAYFGTGADLQIYHSGTESWIKEIGTGALYLASNQIVFNNAATDETMAKFIENGQVELYYDNTKVFETGADEARTKRRMQIHADGPGSGHGMSIGQWDGSNHRIEGDANRPIVITSYNSGGIKMGVSGANKVAVNSNGLVFNGDTAAANALDDYEEGTWTPTLGHSGSTYSYLYQTGSYVKIGRVVHIQFFIQGHRSGGSSTIRLESLPFTIKDGDMTQLLAKDIGLAAYPTSFTYLSGYGMNNNTKFVLFYKNTSGGQANINYNLWSDNSNSPSYIYGNATYFTST